MVQEITILSVNVGPVVALGEHRGQTVLSGIRKHSVTDGREVWVGPEGICDLNGHRIDFQADPRVHGGPNKAVYFYPSEHVPWWAERLGRTLQAGDFGENLTLRGLLETQIVIGQRIWWGEAVLEATGPRRPCFKFQLRHGAGAAQAMMDSGFTGAYFKVVRPGVAPTYGNMTLLDPPAGSVTIAAAFRAKMRVDPTVPGMHD